MSVYLCVSHVCTHPCRPEEGAGCPKAGVLGGGCELFHMGSWEQIWAWVLWKSTASILDC